LPISAGKDIDFYFRDVKALLPNDQVSWTEHSITGSFALAPAGMAVTPATDAFYRIDDLFDHTRYEGYNKHSRTLVLKNAQQKLKNAGIYSGTVDGASGPATGTAIRSWQGRQGLPVTGRLDEETLNSLDLSDEKEIVIKPTPRPAPAAAATPRQTGGQGAGGSRAPGLPQSSPLSALDENLHAGRISRAAYEQKRRELMLLGR
jgi:peptidoglycan hydrolase-like protein with peptidoglycan-binding domain